MLYVYILCYMCIFYVICVYFMLYVYILCYMCIFYVICVYFMFARLINIYRVDGLNFN